MKIADLRTEYMRETLDESGVAADPYRQFERWFAEAVKSQLHEPNAMTLATIDPDGRPAARIVLLKIFDDRGFVFFTNYLSRKGRALAAKPAAALLFFWPDLERQVRIEGVAAPLEPPESAAYFAERPRSSQLGAWASPQSEPIAGRADLEARFAEAEARYADASRRRTLSAALGRLPPRPRHDRVLAGSRLAPARSHPLSTQPRARRRVGHRPAGAVSGDAGPNSRTLAALIPLGIANHAVLTGSRVIVALDALSMGASPFTVGVLSRSTRSCRCFSSVAAGRLVDRIGARRPMLIGSLAVGIAATLPVAFPGLPSLFVGAMLLGIGFMAFQLAAQNTTGEIGGPAARARNFSLLALGYSVSSFIGPLLAGFAIDHFGFRAAFAIFALIPLIPILGSRARTARPVGSACPGRGHAPRRDRGAAAPSHAAPVFAANALMSLGWDLHTIFVPIYGARIGLSASQIGGVLSSFAAATFVVRFFMPTIARQLREHQVLAAALLLCGRGVLRVSIPAERGRAVRAFVHARTRSRRRAAGGHVALAHARAARTHRRSRGRPDGARELDVVRGARRPRGDRRVRRHRAGVLGGRRLPCDGRPLRAAGGALAPARSYALRFNRSVKCLRNFATFGATTTAQYGWAGLRAKYS